MSNTAIGVENLKKCYEDVIALGGVTFQVNKGEVFGIVGPNGAGKTTTIDCIAGMRTADSGSISILGMNPAKQMKLLRKRIGLQQQESELPDRIKVIEAVNLFRTLFRSEISADSLLESVGLSDKADRFFSALSGGEKKRLFVALAMVNDPEILLLDELTSGLDPRGRLKLWKLIEDFRSHDRTVIISTHHMDEARKLCDRIAVFNAGNIVAIDSPEALIRTYCPGIRLKLGCGADFDISKAKSFTGVLTAMMKGETCIMKLDGAESVVPVIQSFMKEGISPGDLHTETPTLEDVFMILTGKEFQNAE